MNVEKSSDEPWVGVKGQSNSVIAGSPRNMFSHSLAILCHGGRALIGLGSPPGYQILSNSECRRHLLRESAYEG